MPPKGRCKPKNALKEPKEIIRNVSGTVMPGQFLAIIGASGKYIFWSWLICQSMALLMDLDFAIICGQ